MKLRDYQEQILQDYYKCKQYHKSVVIQLPTGTGKSVIANHLIQKTINDGLQVLVLVPNCTLVDNMLKYIPEKSTIAYSGVTPDLTKPVLISTYQSAGKYIKKLHNLGLIITDECHHAVSPTLKRIYKQAKGVYHVGFTATTRRLDKYGLDQVYTQLITSKPIGYFINRGYLCDFEVIVPNDVPINFTNLYNFEKDISDKLKQLPSYESLLNLFHTEDLYNSQTIIFNVDIEHSKQVTRALVNKGIKAYHIDGTMSASERQAVINLFKQGVIKVINNVNCLSEGVDIPEIDCVTLNCFNKSEVEFYQKLGRGLRPNKPGKVLKVLDLGKNFYFHGNPKNDKFWDIKTRTSIKPKKSANIKYCAYCEEPLGYIHEIWPNELLKDDNFYDYIKKNLCCNNTGCLSHTVYDTEGNFLDTQVVYTLKTKQKNPTSASLNNVKGFDRLNLNNAELASIILKKKPVKWKIEKIVDMSNIDSSVRILALSHLGIPRSNIIEYFEDDDTITEKEITKLLEAI